MFLIVLINLSVVNIVLFRHPHEVPRLPYGVGKPRIVLKREALSVLFVSEVEVKLFYCVLESLMQFVFFKKIFFLTQKLLKVFHRGTVQQEV